MMAVPHPICVSIILCDLVIEDKRTHNKSFIGTFNQIWSPHIPAKHDRMFVVVTLTECHGRHELALEFTRDTQDGEVQVLQMQGELNTPDPLTVVDLIFEVRGFPLESSGKHTIKVKAQPGGEILSQRHFTVNLAEG